MIYALKMERWDEVIKYSQQAIDLGHKYWDSAILYKIVAYRNQNNLHLAAKEATKLINKVSSNDATHLFARMHLGQMSPESLIESAQIKSADKKDKGILAEALYHAGEIYLSTGKKDRAFELFENAKIQKKHPTTNIKSVMFG